MMTFLYGTPGNAVDLCERYCLRVMRTPWRMRPMLAAFVHGEASLGANLLDGGIIAVFTSVRSWKLDMLHELAHYVVGGFEDERYVMPLQWVFIDAISEPERSAMRRRMLREYVWDPERALMWKDALADKKSTRDIGGAFRMLAHRRLIRDDGGGWRPTFRIAPHVARARKELLEAQTNFDWAMSRYRL